jgi:uncharacterized membrane protein YccC
MPISTAIPFTPSVSSRRFLFLLWSRLASTDPGLLRLLLAVRGTLSVVLAGFLIAGTAFASGAPGIEMAFGAVFSMVGPFVMRDPTRRGRQITMLLLLPPAAASVTCASLLAEHPPLGEIFFLVLLFVSALLQGRHPRAIGIGLIAVVMTYIGLYLHLPPKTLPLQLASLVIGAAAIALVCFVLFPLRPVVTLRRAVRSVQHRASSILQEATEPADPATLRRHLQRLNEAALAAEDQLELLDEPARLDVRLHLFGLEQAVARLVAVIGAEQLPPRHFERLRLAADRLRWGRASRRLTSGLVSNPLEAALHALSQASAGLQTAASRAVAISDRAGQKAPPRPGALRWRSATQVTLAATVAMLGGMALSPQRWFWAVIAVYIVFLNTRTRGDALQRGWGRLFGTFAGLFGGLAIAYATAGNAWVGVAIMLLSVFATYYFYAISYTTAMFCVTILLGLIYGVMGAPIEPVLLLRLEETAIGVGAAVVSAFYIWPVPTEQQVRLSGQGVLRALREVVLTSVAVAEGAPRLGAIESVRRLDRQIGDLRLALQPLTAGRFLLRRAQAERPLTALLACAEAARALADSVGAGRAEVTALQAQAEHVVSRIDALLAGGKLPAVSADTPQTETPLQQLELALDLLSDRLVGNDLDVFAV